MRYLITGSTGWFGRWLVPYLESQGKIVLRESRSYDPPKGKFEYIIHCSRGPAKPYLKYLEDGGEMLVCSSGAVTHSPRTNYAKEKRIDESLPNVKIARCYSFISHDTPDIYAAGQFLHLPEVRVTGSGRSTRSYMHMRDLCEWLAVILHKGKRGIPYNVGSDYYTTIDRFAAMIAEARKVPFIITRGEDTGIPHYVPSIILAKDLGLKVSLRLEEAIHESINPTNPL